VAKAPMLLLEPALASVETDRMPPLMVVAPL
jgi:hypothetical protein